MIGADAGQSGRDSVSVLFEAVLWFIRPVFRRGSIVPGMFMPDGRMFRSNFGSLKLPEIGGRGIVIVKATIVCQFIRLALFSHAQSMSRSCVTVARLSVPLHFSTMAQTYRTRWLHGLGQCWRLPRLFDRYHVHACRQARSLASVHSVAARPSSSAMHTNRYWRRMSERQRHPTASALLQQF